MESQWIADSLTVTALIHSFCSHLLATKNNNSEQMVSLPWPPQHPPHPQSCPPPPPQKKTQKNTQPQWRQKTNLLNDTMVCCILTHSTPRNNYSWLLCNHCIFTKNTTYHHVIRCSLPATMRWNDMSQGAKGSHCCQLNTPWLKSGA